MYQSGLPQYVHLEIELCDCDCDVSFLVSASWADLCLRKEVER